MDEDYEQRSDLGRDIKDREKIAKLETKYRQLLHRKNRVTHYYNVFMLEHGLLNRPPDVDEFRDLSICGQM